MNGEPGWSKDFAQFSKPIVNDGEQKERSHEGFFFPLNYSSYYMRLMCYVMGVLTIFLPGKNKEFLHLRPYMEG